jgi:hypothetical protein
MRSVIFRQGQQRNECYGKYCQGEGARRVSLAPPSLHSVQDGLVVHCHRILVQQLQGQEDAPAPLCRRPRRVRVFWKAKRAPRVQLSVVLERPGDVERRYGARSAVVLYASSALASQIAEGGARSVWQHSRKDRGYGSL